jgi:SWI/SNF related-matrix-associated actin-dependent regulator of chromatin subfamily C
MTIVRHKDGHPNVKFFESIETLNQFDTIRKALQKKDLKKTFGDDQHHLTKDNIGQLVIQLLHFQEDHLGKKSNGSAPVIRIPVREKQNFIYDSIIFLSDGMFFGFS